MYLSKATVAGGSGVFSKGGSVSRVTRRIGIWLYWVLKSSLFYTQSQIQIQSAWLMGGWQAAEL
jgi:hypothetical protein